MDQRGGHPTVPPRTTRAERIRWLDADRLHPEPSQRAAVPLVKQVAAGAVSLWGEARWLGAPIGNFDPSDRCQVRP